ncbi:MAG TPA: hypothetical protein VNT53_02495 [Pseudolysinimonas sp.]|nr:hypothetical protein [Pseudolysinimonas sp.]
MAPEASDPDAQEGRPKTLVERHGRALIEVALASGFGILASAGFQVVATRGLGPKEFGLLAAFLALINIAAIGSAALRNSVAVTIASAPASATTRIGRRIDSSLIEALALGGIFAVGLIAASPWLAGSLQSSPVALAVTAATIVPYFLFARGLGILQGRGRSRAVVWWSTGAQFVQLILAVLALALGYGAVGILVVFLVSVLVATIGSGYQTRHLMSPVTTRPFEIDSMVVVALTIAFAWLTNVDVILVKAGAADLLAGSYAAAAVLVKTTLILPATLSLYLLPRFVGSRGNVALTRLGVRLTLLFTFLGGVVILAVLTLGGGLIVPLLYGPGYQLTISLLPWLCLMWLPWAMTQAILVRITSISSKVGLAILGGAMVAQWVGCNLVLPNIQAMIAVNTSIGVVSFVALFLVHHRHAQRIPEDVPTVED